MTKNSITQSQKRFQESVGKLFEISDPKLKKCVFISSSTDVGVIRNGGRNGARYAPKAFLSTFKKFTLIEKLNNYQFVHIETGDAKAEEKDFIIGQSEEAIRIRDILKSEASATFVHLGGGHDHIYPLMKAIVNNYKKIIVINIDAHADTRSDLNPHSGTPFRQFGEEFPGKLHLYQIGLNEFSNSYSTLESIEKTQMNILWMNEISSEKLKTLFLSIQEEICESSAVILSLDSDALNGSIMPGVSAVNPSGLYFSQLLEILKHYKNLKISHSPIIGIYELNPLYDTLAGLSMRTIGHFVFELL